MPVVVEKLGEITRFLFLPSTKVKTKREKEISKERELLLKWKLEQEKKREIFHF